MKSYKVSRNRHLRPLGFLEQLLFILLFLLLPIEREVVLQVNGFTIRPVYFVMFTLLIFFIANLRFLRLSQGIGFFAMIMSAYVLASARFSMEPRVAFFYALWAMFTVVFSTLAAARLRYKPVLAELWVRWSIRSAALWSLVATLQWFLSFSYHFLAYSFLGDFPRVHALTLEPSYLATYLVFPFFLALQRGWSGYSALIGAALVFSTSRTGMVSLALGLAILLLVKLLLGKIRLTINAKLLAKLLAVIFIITIFLIPILKPAQAFFSSIADFVSSGLTLKDVSSAVPRLKSWEDAIRVFIQKPWTGVGIGTYGYGLSQLGLVVSQRVDVRALKTTNLYLEVAAEMGIPGLLLLMYWIALPIWNLRKCPLPSLGFNILLAFIVLTFTLPFIQTWWRPYLWIPWALGAGYVCRR